MLPVVIALTGTGEKFETKMFLAWFGPRGLASIVFLIIVVGGHLPSQSILVQTVVCTVTLCVIAHGLTANVWAKGIASNPDLLRRTCSSNFLIPIQAAEN
jgi:NhaP-type Na+/H+ or K+/H+ antiporter